MRLLLYIVALAGYLLAAADGFSFGIRGQNGESGRDGISGKDGTEAIIYVRSKPTFQNLKGSDGTDGQVGMPGYDAYQCRQPYRVRSNVKGADGGDGGHGGNGGNGGNGGSATIFYKNISDLKNLTLINHGGIGGIGAKGGDYGGYPCLCQEKSWQFFKCEWRLLRKSHEFQGPGGWERTWRTKTTDCTNTRRPPARKRPDETYRYKWELKRETPETFYCDDGVRGYAGTYGDNGRDGSYGNVTLIKGSTFPKESSVYKAKLTDSLSKFYTLSKNVYAQREDLKNLLADDSKISGTYKIFLRTDVKKFGIAWRLPHGPAYYGLKYKEIKVSLVQGAGDSTEFKIELQGDPIFETVQLDANHWQLRITGFRGKEPAPGDSPDQCNAKNGKGSNLCEMSGKCVYETGICKPR